MTRILPLLILIGLTVSPAAADDLFPTAQRDHWAWKRPARPPVPAVKNATWPNNPLDGFVLARLEGAGLAPAVRATDEQLLRRVTFDLTGLPPTLQEVDAFLSDRSPGAWARVVDRLLASPAYGERWGRHWLDVARFAESNGYEFDEIRPDAWRYRDYVIAALNADKPYDRFVLEQLAGDELWPDDPAALVATGFNLLGPDMTDASDQAQRRQNTLNDMTDVSGLAFLGMTLNCARCHDHKFEPIPQTDYYRLQAFYTPAVFRRDLPIAPREQRQTFDRAQQTYTALVKPIQEALARLEEPHRQRLHEAAFARLADEAQVAHKTPSEKRTLVQKELVEKTTRLLNVSPQSISAALSPAERTLHKQLQDELKTFDSRKPTPLPSTMGLTDALGGAGKTFLLERGEMSQRGDEVVPGYPVILRPEATARPAYVTPPREGTTGRRTALARWVVSPENPLAARVLVNRLWQHHFGRGLVGTPNDFGLRGERPTHPELLDWLARELVASGWSLKHIHRLLLLSATYQQSSHPSAEARQHDPDNRFFARAYRLRLEGEVIRDSLLAVSGRLNRTMGGRGVFPPVPADVHQGTKAWATSPDPRDHVRRSVYIFARRNLRFPFLEAFDPPDTNQSCPRRERSTTAPQALALLNAGDVMEAARALAKRVEREAVGEERIEWAYRLSLGRRPSMKEQTLAREFLRESPLEELCRAMFNINEFAYRE